MKLINIQSVLSFLLAAFAVSCTAPIDLNTKDSDPVIVIYGFLTEDSVHQKIRITRSIPYFEAKPNEPVSDALVEVRSGNGTVFTYKETENKGYYQSIDPIAAIPGQIYSLRVQVDFNNDGGLELYEAQTTMQHPFEVDSIQMKEIYIMGYRHYTMYLYAQELPGKDYYFTRFIRNDTLIENRISKFLTFNDEGFDGQYLNGIAWMIFNDPNNGQSVDKADSLSYVEAGDKVTLCMSRIEKGYFEFIEQCQKEKNGENPFFGGPASNITTNLSNGAVGYFSSFSTSRVSAYVPKDEKK